MRLGHRCLEKGNTDGTYGLKTNPEVLNILSSGCMCRVQALGSARWG